MGVRISSNGLSESCIFSIPDFRETVLSSVCITSAYHLPVHPIAAMIPGKKIFAIFGFCDIRMFNDITEILEEKVMIFVNEIADIVHTTVTNYEGAINK